MKTPKFKVGEEVILQSVEHPQFNGEYTVYKILFDFEENTCRLTGEEYIWRSSPGIGGFIYLLNPPFSPDPSGIEGHWDQSALRKKHRPSDDSFGELMNGLKSGKLKGVSCD